jgi:2-C-methyl-D-erythritol 2,4-cyclodiphosphate synthase
MTDFRIGQGYDVHRLIPGEYLTLGGVKIPFEKKFQAHSDGDVVIHAIIDALLGAAGLGDIGRHFPDTDAQFKNIDSGILLQNTLRLIKQQHFKISNVDVTIIAERPRLALHIPQMRENIARDLALDISQINIKATTNEKLGFIGREEGIAAQAVALIAHD